MESNFSIAIDQITSSTVRLGVTYVGGSEPHRPVTVTLVLREAESGFQVWYDENATGPASGTAYPTIQPSGLTPGTLYEVELIDADGIHQTAYFWTTGGTQSYTATVGQWQDLVGRIKALDTRVAALENA